MNTETAISPFAAAHGSPSRITAARRLQDVPGAERSGRSFFFYVGLDDLYYAFRFSHSFISVNRLRERKSPFKVNDWIMDSGAFTEITTHGGYRTERLSDSLAAIIPALTAAPTAALTIASKFVEVISDSDNPRIDPVKVPFVLELTLIRSIIRVLSLQGYAGIAALKTGLPVSGSYIRTVLQPQRIAAATANRKQAGRPASVQIGKDASHDPAGGLKRRRRN